MAYKTTKEKDKERSLKLAQQWQANNNTKLDANQEATLRRMIEVNNPGAQQELRRADYYNGNQDKYDVTETKSVYMNDNTGRNNTHKREVFALKDGYSEPTMEGRYSGSDDSFSKSRLNGGDRLQKAVNSVRNPMSIGNDDSPYESSSTSSKPKQEKKPGFWSDVKDTFKTIGEVVNPFDDVTASEAVKDFTQNGFKNTDTTETNRLANRTLDAATFNSASAVMKKFRGQQAVDWQGNRKFGEGGGADMAADALGYLASGLGIAKGLQGTKFAANLAGKGALGKAVQIAKEGAIIGGIQSAAETPAKAYVNPDMTAADHAKNLAFNVGTGIVLDPALHGLGTLMGKAVNKAISKYGASAAKKAEQAAQGAQPQQAASSTGAGTTEAQKQMPMFGEASGRDVAARKNNAPVMPTKTAQTAAPEPIEVQPTTAPVRTAKEIEEDIQNTQSQIAFNKIMGGTERPELHQRLAGLQEESAAANARLQEATSNLPFGHMGSRTPAARKPSTQEVVENVANDVLFQGKSPKHWQQRYNDFTEHVNSRYDRSATMSNRKEFKDAVEQQYQYLKNSMGKGVEPGGIIRDNTGDVVSRYGRISNNPTWYQDFYRANGRKPNNAELRSLAEQQVKNGYNENGVDIPAWGPKAVKDLDEQIDEIRAISQADPEEGAALQPVLKALEQERAGKIEEFHKTADGLKPDDLENLWRGFAGDGEDMSLQELISLAHYGEKGSTPFSELKKKLPFDEPDLSRNNLQEFDRPSKGETRSARNLIAKNAPELLDPSLKTLMKRDPQLNNAIRALFGNGEAPKAETPAPKAEQKVVSEKVIPKNQRELDKLERAKRSLSKVSQRQVNTPKSRPLGAVEPSSKELPTLEEVIAPEGKTKGVEAKPEPQTEKKQLSKAKDLPKGTKAMTAATDVLPPTSSNGKTISMKDLLDSFRKIGAPIRTGRMGTGEDIKGIYKENPEVIRTKDYGDIQGIAHELGHDLDKKFNLANERFDDELIKLGQETSMTDYSPEEIRQEGVGEFLRRFLINPEQAKEEAPEFFKHFQNVIPKKVMKNLVHAQESTQTWLTQPADMRARGRINSEAAPKGIAKVKETLKNLPKSSEEAYTEGVDRFFPISKMEKEIAGTERKVLGGLWKVTDLPDAKESAYKQATLAAGTPRIAEQKLQDLEPIFKNLRDKGYEMQDLSDYVTAVHAKNLEAQGIQSGFKSDEIEATLKKYDNEDMQGMQKQIVKYNNSLLDILVDAQVLSKDAVKAMREKHPDYVAFFRHFDEESKAGLGSGKGFVDLTNPVKRMKGSSRNVINPLESMIKSTFSAVQAAEKNKVGLKLAELAKKPGAGKWIEKLDGKESVPNENVVTVFQNGEKVQYQLAPELYKSVKALDKEVTNKYLLLAGKATDWLRAGATLTPEFMMRNPWRDQFHAMVVSDTGYNPLDLLKGLKEIRKEKFGGGSDVYKDWVKHGGAYGGYLSSDRDILQESLRNLENAGKPGIQRAIDVLKNPSQWGHKTLELLQKGSEISEEATKVGAYAKGIKKGLSPEESAFQSKDLMNFNRTGNTMQAANRVVAFLNANVQGKDKLIRAFREHPVRTTSRILGTTVPPSIVAMMSESWASDKQKEIMDNTPQQEKDTYWQFAVPGSDLVARIPKPFDIGVVPNTVERGIDAMNGDPYAFEGYGDTLKNAAALPWLPTAVLPIIENMSNHSFFWDAPVVPQRDQSNSPRMQYGPTTSLAAREIGDKLNVSPYKVDNLYKGYTAGLGQYPLEALSKVISLISNKDVPTPVGKKATESIPGVRAFFSNDMSGGKIMDEYYKVMEEQEAVFADEKDQGIKHPSNEADLKAFKKINKDMNAARGAYREIMASTDMSPEEKRAAIDDLNEQMREIAREGVLIFKPDYQ